MRRVGDLPDFEARSNDLLVIDIGNVEMDGLELTDGADYLDDVVDAFLVAPGEGDAFRARPTDPGAGMSLPFRREGKPLSARACRSACAY